MRARLCVVNFINYFLIELSVLAIVTSLNISIETKTVLPSCKNPNAPEVDSTCWAHPAEVDHAAPAQYDVDIQIPNPALDRCGAACWYQILVESWHKWHSNPLDGKTLSVDV